MGPLLLHHPWVQFYVLLVGALWMVVLWNDYLRHCFRLRNRDPKGFPGDTGNHSSRQVLPDPAPWSQNASLSVGVGRDIMFRNRFAAMFNVRSEPGNLRPLAAAFVPYPTGFFPNAQQQWVYQKAYQQALEEVALMARRERTYAFALN